jgi:hypothetical protein
MKTRISKFGSVGDWQKTDERFDETITKQTNDGSCVAAVGEMLAKHYGLKTNQEEILKEIGAWSNSAALAKFLSSKESRKDVEWVGSFFGNDARYIAGVTKELKVWAVMLSSCKKISCAFRFSIAFCKTREQIVIIIYHLSFIIYHLCSLVIAAFSLKNR